ncbi:DUF4233 domain-containing protein [Actinocrispum sp. NPDC049592]|uniref:DUF4233 domain-containing protein n=1 Tax=Actinocrispum sp. NPDC049592 TaxID=3154835 RepID=UPI00344112F3
MTERAEDNAPEPDEERAQVTAPDTEATPAASAPDPMKGFRGVAAGALILEAIVVGLSLLVVHRTAGGLGTWKGLLAGGVILALIVTCGLLRHSWSTWLVIAIQVVLIASIFAITELGVVGIIFGLVWAYLLYLRHDVAKRLAEGRLPSQRQ